MRKNIIIILILILSLTFIMSCGAMDVMFGSKSSSDVSSDVNEACEIMWDCDKNDVDADYDTYMGRCRSIMSYQDDSTLSCVINSYSCQAVSDCID